MIKQSDIEKLFRELNPKKSDKFKLGLDQREVLYQPTFHGNNRGAPFFNCPS
jgi:hypothetical protein